MATWTNHLSSFHRRSGVTGNFVEASRNQLPAEYIELLSFMDGGEGNIGDRYVRIYPCADAIWLNEKSPFREFRDGTFVFGSTGGGEAYGFDQKANNHLVQVPFIPFAREHARAIADDCRTWLLSGSATSPHAQELINKEIHEIKPIVFGGDPIDPKNKTLVEFQPYIEVVVWFNNLHRQMTSSALPHNPPQRRASDAGIFSVLRKWFGRHPGH